MGTMKDEKHNRINNNYRLDRKRSICQKWDFPKKVAEKMIAAHTEYPYLLNGFKDVCYVYDGVNNTFQVYHK